MAPAVAGAGTGAPFPRTGAFLQSGRVLVVGSGSTRLTGSAPALERQGIEVDRMSSQQGALDLAKHVRFDLALLDYAPSGPAVMRLAMGLVEAGLPDHRTNVVLVALPDKVEEARTYVGNAVSAVLSATAPPEEFAQVLHEILGASPRVGVRVSVRLEVRLQEEGPSLAFRQTEDLSAAGMLVRTPRVLPIGTDVSFRVDLPGDRRSVEGKARVVRHVLEADGKTVCATGMRFLSFKGDDDARLRSFVECEVRSKADHGTD